MSEELPTFSAYPSLKHAPIQTSDGDFRLYVCADDDSCGSVELTGLSLTSEADGADVGAALGNAVGNAVGNALGHAVGALLGYFVGYLVGYGVELVGYFVLEVGHSTLML